MDLREDFFTYQAQTTEQPFGLDIVKAEGIYLYDRQGKQYIDLVSGVSVSNIGHRHPKVIKAIHEQVDKYLHVMVYGEYIQEPQVKLAKALANILPEKLNCSYFVNSGTEANEAAIKLAKRYTGRTEIISMYKSYHGSTHGSLSVTGNEEKKYFARPLLPDVKFIEFNNSLDLNEITEKTACVIVEPIQGDAGVRIPTHEYMQALRAKCNETGALLLFDEVQTGYGRTGTMFAFEHFNVVPDILTIGKAMAGGMAMGTFISSKEIMTTLSNNPMLGHITTFGGHPVCCAAAHATIEAFQEENIVCEVNNKGDLFAKLLSHSIVKEIRYKGLFFAIELDAFETVQKVVNRCLEKGIVGFWFISCNNAFRLAPPLVITEEEIRISCGIIQSIFDEIQNNLT
jgi:acetylornithine/N-succinyldiaminopimelate aminotransferase